MLRGDRRPPGYRDALQGLCRNQRLCTRSIRTSPSFRKGYSKDKLATLSCEAIKVEYRFQGSSMTIRRTGATFSPGHVARLAPFSHMRMASSIPGELIPLPSSGSIPELPHVAKLGQWVSDRQRLSGRLSSRRLPASHSQMQGYSPLVSARASLIIFSRSATASATS